MPKICYDPERKFTAQIERMIQKANSILEEYERQGFTLTLRQLYYQLIARDLFPNDRKFAREGGKWVRHPNGTKNAEPNYDWLGAMMSDARLAGLVDWDYMVDRTRHLRDLQHFDSAQDAVNKLAQWYHVDMWENQDTRPEVWVEKDALVGVIEPICNELDVPYFSCRGYTSQSEMWRAAMRLKRHQELGYNTHIIHLGDHDPSGVDMSRDIFDRVEMFMGGTEFTRIALTMEQVEQYNPPPNPAKVLDSRCKAYVEQFGDECWELDALQPETLTALIRAKVDEFRDTTQWAEDTDRKQYTKAKLVGMATHWPGVVKWLDREEAKRAKKDAKKKK